MEDEKPILSLIEIGERIAELDEEVQAMRKNSVKRRPLIVQIEQLMKEYNVKCGDSIFPKKYGV